MLVFQFVLFILTVIVCFTIPGLLLLILSKSTLKFIENITLGTVIGYVVFTLICYLGLISKMPHISIVYVVIINCYFLSQFKKLQTKIIFYTKNQLVLLITVFTLGILGQMAIIAPSGFIYDNNLLFWSAHGHDSSWHLSLMEEINKGLPLQNPVFAGEKLVNYHFFSDIAPAFMNHYLKFSSLDLYFRFFPIIFSILLGILTFIIGKQIGQSFYSGLWATIFTYFAGSFGYIVTYMQSKTISGESLFWSTQPQSIIGNPPQIAATIIFLSFLYLFYEFQNHKGIVRSLLLILLAGSIIEFKVYAGIIILGGLGIVGIWQIIKSRKFDIISVFIPSLLLSLGLYMPNNSASTSFLVFEPWWYVRTMVVATDKLNWLDLELRRQTYIADQNWKRVIELEGEAFLIFLFGNLGMRFIGIYDFTKMCRTFFSNYFNQIYILMLLISFTFPMLFLQKGVASNTSQFFQYFLILIGILAGVSTARFLGRIKNKIPAVFISLIIITISIPTQIGLLYSFYSHLPLAKITSHELNALEFIKTNTDKNDIILTPPYNQYFTNNDKIPNIWDWYDTGYVSGFSGRRTFVSDIEQIKIMGYDPTSRIDLQQQIFNESDPKVFTNLLTKNNINLLYFQSQLKPKVNLNKTSLNKIYQNQNIQIWKVNN